MSEEKTEKPTEKKLQKVREDGSVAKSADLVEAACLGGALLGLQLGARYLDDAFHTIVGVTLNFVGGDDHSMATMQVALYQIFETAFGIMGAFCAVALVAAIIALAPQTGFKIAFKVVTPKLSAVNPSTGLKKIFSLNAVIDLIKMTVKAIVIITVMWQTVKSVLPLVTSAIYQPLPRLTSVLWTVLCRVLAIASGVFFVIAAIDLKLQHWMFTRRNRMSKDEVKREHKDSGGNPQIKQERRRLAKKFADEGPLRGISRANVLVVNPTHYAVALRYDPREFPLPVVIAKGVDEEAMLLRRFAASAGVPIVANPPVARALHKVKDNQPVPEELFEIVAAILRWVDSLATQRTHKE